MVVKLLYLGQPRVKVEDGQLSDMSEDLQENDKRELKNLIKTDK